MFAVDAERAARGEQAALSAEWWSWNLVVLAAAMGVMVSGGWVDLEVVVGKNQRDGTGRACRDYVYGVLGKRVVSACAGTKKPAGRGAGRAGKRVLVWLNLAGLTMFALLHYGMGIGPATTR